MVRARFAFVRASETMPALSLGTNVMFDDESGHTLVGRVVARDRTSLVVRVTR